MDQAFPAEDLNTSPALPDGTVLTDAVGGKYPANGIIAVPQEDVPSLYGDGSEDTGTQVDVVNGGVLGRPHGWQR